MVARTITRTLTALAVVVFGLMACLAVDAEADMAQVGTLPMADAPKPAPFVWSDGCTPTDDWPKGEIPATAQVQPFEQYDRPATTVPFDVAWDANHDADQTNDLYVIGLCR